MIQLAKPNIPKNAIEELSRVLNSGMLVQNKEVLNFENRIAKYLNVNHAICVSNGTASLHLSLVALGIGEGDEVIVPAFSYVATANVVEIVGAKPIFVDIDVDTFNIDTSKIEDAITSKTKAIIPVHEFGLSANITEIVNIANKNKLLVIEDAACALGAKENDKYVGTFGDLGSFSFHPRKAITSGEGGIITTNNESLAKEVRILRNHGIDINNGKMNFVRAGFNYRLTDLQAVLVNSQFTNFDSVLEYKAELAKVYISHINNDLVKTPELPKDKNHTWQTFHILMDNEYLRDKLKTHLFDSGVMSNYGAQCIPEMTYYKEKYNLNSQKKFPAAYKAFTCGLAIPLYDLLTVDEVKFISKLINDFK